MMNNEMMRQLQARMLKMQEDLASQTVEASAGGGAVTVTISEIGMGPAQAKSAAGQDLPRSGRSRGHRDARRPGGRGGQRGAEQSPESWPPKKSRPLTGGMKLPGMP